MNLTDFITNTNKIKARIAYCPITLTPEEASYLYSISSKDAYLGCTIVCFVNPNKTSNRTKCYIPKDIAIEFLNRLISLN